MGVRVVLVKDNKVVCSVITMFYFAKVSRMDDVNNRAGESALSAAVHCPALLNGKFTAGHCDLLLLLVQGSTLCEAAWAQWPELPERWRWLLLV